jgi:hypothetical protein
VQERLRELTQAEAELARLDAELTGLIFELAAPPGSPQARAVSKSASEG